MISVIVPTYRRHAYLLNMLDDLRSQTVQPSEVFVIDQTPEEERPNKFYDRWGDWSVLKIIDSVERGTCVARNRGIRESTGDWLLFLDDDVRFRKNLISEYLRVAEETKADVVHGGVVTNSGSADDPVDWASLELPEEKIQNSKNDPITALISSPNHSRRAMCIGIASGNCLAKRETVLRVGGFDEAFKDGAYEDYDFGLRLFQSGAILVYDPSPFVLHLRAVDGGCRIVFRNYFSQVFRPEPHPNIFLLFQRHWPEWGYKMIQWKYRRQALNPKGSSLLCSWRIPIHLIRYFRSCREAERRIKLGRRLISMDPGR